MLVSLAFASPPLFLVSSNLEPQRLQRDFFNHCAESLFSAFSNAQWEFQDPKLEVR